jgi:TPR repeat protein
MGPWEPPTAADARTAPLFLLVLAVLLALASYSMGTYRERQQLKDPAVRLEVALQDVRAGSDDAARRLLTPLADAGNATAQYWLADLYQYGLGVGRDPQKAIELLTKSAGQGFVPAEERLGEFYLNGSLVLQDLTLAREWLGKAAAAGNDIAQYDLSQIFDQGLGVPADPVQAYAWAAVAAAHGNALAQRERDRILASLSPEQVTEAEARARQVSASQTAPAAAGTTSGSVTPARSATSK